MLPQLLFLGLVVLSCGFNLAMDGKPRSNYSFWAFFFSAAIEISLLWWGGFFNVFFK